MLVVYHELLAESYLIILAPGLDDTPEASLNYCLHRASHSGKPAVWVDCTLLDTLPEAAIAVLMDYHKRLLTQQVRLVLVHVPKHVEEEIRQWGASPHLCIVPTLLDAAHSP